jgi:IS30 family transposase
VKKEDIGNNPVFWGLRNTTRTERIPMSYVHFTPMERGKIELLHQQGLTFTAIAKQLGRHRTSIGREIRRNRRASGYGAQAAQQRYQQRRGACRPRGRLAYEPLREYVSERIAVDKWTPELVAGSLALKYSGNPDMQLCHETIYSAIYANRHQLDYLLEFLPQARPKRRKRGQGKTRRGPSIPNRVSIKERPAHIEERKEVGHWEGDLIVGRSQEAFILTLVERASRLLLATKTQTKRAAEISQATIDAMLDYPVSWVKTITFDNGTEFAEHKTMSDALDVAIYFADPYSAFQRGSNEQINGLVRRYLPKGTPFGPLTEQNLQTIVQEINNRPRKCLGYRTPNEVFEQQRQGHQRALRT